MAKQKKDQLPMFEVDMNSLYREETYTDLKAASIRKLYPIKPDGSPDDSRRIMYIGHAELISPQGPIPLQADLSADSLEKAFQKLPTAMSKAAHDVKREYDQMMLQQKMQEQTKGQQGGNFISSDDFLNTKK